MPTGPPTASSTPQSTSTTSRITRPITLGRGRRPTDRTSDSDTGRCNASRDASSNNTSSTESLDSFVAASDRTLVTNNPEDSPSVKVTGPPGNTGFPAGLSPAPAAEPAVRAKQALAADIVAGPAAHAANAAPKPPAALAELAPAARVAMMNDGAPSMANGAAAGQEVATTCRIPPFWRSQPTLWFYQIESIMQVHRIRSDANKYHLTVGALDADALAEVSDLLRDPPPEHMYQALKTRILERLTDSADRQLQKMLTELELGSRKPSHNCTGT